MTFDPTTNTKPVRDLSQQELNALQKWPWGWEFKRYVCTGGADKWMTINTPGWMGGIVYRGKKPPDVKIVPVTRPHKRPLTNWELAFFMLFTFLLVGALAAAFLKFYVDPRLQLSGGRHVENIENTCR